MTLVFGLFLHSLSSSLGKANRLGQGCLQGGFPKRSAQIATAHGLRQICSDPAEEQPGCFSCFCGLFSSRSDVELSVSHVNNASTKLVRLVAARKNTFRPSFLHRILYRQVLSQNALILYTSGTTGQPKGADMSSRAAFSSHAVLLAGVVHTFNSCSPRAG